MIINKTGNKIMNTSTEPSERRHSPVGIPRSSNLIFTELSTSENWLKNWETSASVTLGGKPSQLITVPGSPTDAIKSGSSIF